MKKTKFTFIIAILLFGAICSCESEQNKTRIPLGTEKSTSSNLNDVLSYSNNLNEAYHNREYVTTLYLPQYNHNTLSDSITALSRLQIIEIRNASKLDFKDTFQKLGLLPKLNDIKIVNSRLKALPIQVYLMDELRRLSIDDDSLSFIPDDLKLSDSLVELKLSRNIRNLVFNKSYRYIRELDLSNNPELKKVDSSIIELKNLEELNLQNTAISDLPDEVTKLKKLKIIKLAGTPLGEAEHNHLKKTQSFNKLLPLFESNPDLKVYLGVKMEYE
ncbi:hypothetical protein ACFSRY_13290 [Pontibacter locisalis]|uniref:Leucine-rich repeat domain-containing protein n=1 Tax=Pontibacter locisalis TaxID=1719035 RepID=A0ABW5IMG3_9BACT